MISYPAVLGELETLQAVCAGRSLARYGDGEFALCRGRSIRFQRHDYSLQGRLRGILRTEGACLVGIPNILSATPKAKYWEKYRAAADLLGGQTYASAFISRPDSAPWIDTPEYWSLVASLWRGQEVTVVRGASSSLNASDLEGARLVSQIHASSRDAWFEYRSLFERIRAAGPERVLLSLGPTATVLAVDLCAHGFHAVDLGHLAVFLRKHRRGEPMVLSGADRLAMRPPEVAA